MRRPMMMLALSVLPLGCQTINDELSTPRGEATTTVPVIERAIIKSYAPSQLSNESTLLGTRIEFSDEQGRLFRWEERGPDGALDIAWVATYPASGIAPDRAAYWSADNSLPYPELCVTSPDGTYQDVLFADPGETPRRQMRQYFDAAGRIIYQEYFAPATQRKYSEEIYRYDANGNERRRTWRRLNGTAQRDTVFEIIESDDFGHWTRRRLIVNGTAERDIPKHSV